MKSITTAITFPLLFAFATVASGNPPFIYQRAEASVDTRVYDLIGRMTLDEKIAQLESEWSLKLGGGADSTGLVKEGKVDDRVARQVLPNGIGTFVMLSIPDLPLPAAGALERNAIQSWVMSNTRLRIPVMFHGEALHGATVRNATTFPQAIGLGSTWDRDLVRRVFGIVGEESRAAGNSMVLAPVFDLARDPRFGRVEEMYSEDPYLVGEMGLAAVQGLQGNAIGIDQSHVIATAKHFVHGQPENGTNVGPNDFSERTMRSVFMSPFEKAVKIGKIGAVMPSYNENDGGIPSSANSWLLVDILRKEWGFTGITASDYFAVPQLAQVQLVARDLDDSGVLAFKSGLDMELPHPTGFTKLASEVRAGKVSESQIDEAVKRVLSAKVNLGLFEHPYTDPRRAAQIVGNKANIPLARKAADEAIVLLKNDGNLLPLNLSGIKTLAVIGPNADKARLGGYTGRPAYFVTVLEGIRRRAGNSVHVAYAEGARISEPDISAEANKIAPYEAPSAAKDSALLSDAVETARASDIVVLVLGENETIAREALGKAVGDKPAYGDTDTLDLPGRQSDLTREILKLGKPTIVVLLNGRALSVEYLSRTVPALVEGWYLGQETGNAIAGVLFGDVNPSGHLPVTIPRNVGQLPVFYYRTPAARLGYVFDSNEPLYPFGFGLSYTTFAFGVPTLDKEAIARDGTATVSVTVTNAGARSGDEVAQLYVHPQVSSVVQPIMRLVGFERVHLNPGETKTVSFELGTEQLAIWNQQMKHVVEAGKVDLMVGSNSQHTQNVQLEIKP
jgi:beta-glucosidase